VNDIPKVTDKDIEEAFDWEAFNRNAKEKYIKDAGSLAESVARGHCTLTAGQLRELLKDVSDDCPVLYQRIEDKYFEYYHWHTISLTWEQEDEYSEYILSFSAHKHKAADGREVFVINAHY
jgi:hypothetical protein